MQIDRPIVFLSRKSKYYYRSVYTQAQGCHSSAARVEDMSNLAVEDGKYTYDTTYSTVDKLTYCI